MLKKDLHDRTWFFDLEWVPDAAGARRLFDLPEGASDLEAMEEIWKHTGRSEADPRPFVKYLYSRIVSIAFLSRNVTYDGPDRKVAFKLYSLPALPVNGSMSDEGQIIEQFLYYIGERKPQLVGFNSSESDVQVLIQRGLINEVSAPMFCERPKKKWEGDDYFERWDNEWHLDLMRLFSTGKMTPKLNDLAKLCGFPGKMDMAGDQVVDLWLRGDLRSIIEYNQIDTLNTYLVWLRVVYFCGKIKEEDYAAEQEAFREFLESESQTPNMAHIGRFLDKWDL